MIPPTPTPSIRIDTYRDRIRDVLADLLPPNTRCALAGYPDHWNVGDAVIWRGTRVLLKTLQIEVGYACDAWSYDPRALENAVPAGPILLCGGGNFGDVYPDETTLRRRLLADFPFRRIIQLPQSLWFQDPANLKPMADLLAQQRDFTLLTRDRASLNLARAHLPVRVLLCPDTALALTAPVIRTTADHPVLALWRDDSETDTPCLPVPDTWHVQDWLRADEDHHMLSVPVRALRWLTGPPPHGSAPTTPPLLRTWAWRHIPGIWEQLADERIARGCRILRRGRVVITNRLHAHLLCVLMRIPHVVCDTVNGKISDYFRTWPLDEPRVQWADTPDEAVEKANGLLARHDAPEPTLRA